MVAMLAITKEPLRMILFLVSSREMRCIAKERPPTNQQKLEFKQMVARLAITKEPLRMILFLVRSREMRCIAKERPSG